MFTQYLVWLFTMQSFLKFSILIVVLTTVALLPVFQRLSAVDRTDMSFEASIIEPSFDFQTDSSITKFIWFNNIINNIEYIPDNLKLVTNDNYHFLMSWKDCYLKENVIEELNNAWYKFWKKFTSKNIKVFLYLNSCYRNYDSQNRLFNNHHLSNKVAKPWYSEHQLGLAVDINVWVNWAVYNLNSAHSNFLSEIMYHYWFHQTYQKWLDIDWYIQEPWHWRYLWKDFATLLHKNKLSFIEYYQSNLK